jgi:biopolymer transport protein ExbD
MPRHRKSEAAPEVELPITPMLDMTFQLLTFFIFTYKPSALEAQMDFTLPATGEAKAKNPDDVDPNRPSDADLAPKSQLTITVKTQQGGGKGGISQIVVRSPSGERTFFTPGELGEYLKSVRPDLQNKDDVQIECESKLKYAEVIRVVDTCRSAKFMGVGFSPPPDLNTSGPD